jgi:hypothetical protein
MALSRLTGGVAVGLCGFVVACGSHPAPRSGIIFWAQSPHGGEDERGSIGRADLIGSGADGRFIVGDGALD